MFPTPRKGDGAMDTNTVETPSSRRGRRGNDLLTPLTPVGAAAMNSATSLHTLSTPSPSPARRRGCNCKKSGCLKLYCECFAAGMRCGDRCQCLGCKNREHNKLEIAHAMETIEKRSQRSSFKSPINTVARRAAAQRPQPRGFDYSIHGENTPISTPSHSRTPVMDGATRLLLSAERLDETPRQKGAAGTAECICAPGACHSACPCHVYFGGCGRRCACHHVPTTQEKAQEKTRGCSCKKSNCLKLYCECLAAQRQCDSRCNCEGCKNHSHHTHERERAIAAILERNPMAFEPKVASGAAQHQRGCNCRKSNCMKNYCECHQAGVPCTGRCACQDCRNTDAFVSAKKMLIFSGDLKVRPNASVSPEGSHSHGHAGTPASAKPPRRPSRHASLDQSSPLSRSATALPPSALDLLSRTAPAAPQPPEGYFLLGGRNHAGRMHTHTKRKQGDATQGDDSSLDGSTDSKRRHAKSTGPRLNFQERLERAASSPIRTIRLPPVESVLDVDVDGAQPEPPLSTLCRSLLHAAASVDVTLTPRKARRHSTETVRTAFIDRVQDQRQVGGAVSPMTDDLLCEEDIETPTRGSSGPTSTTAAAHGANGEDETNNGFRRSADAVDKQRAADLRLEALQERAVLQEFSVWLRNLASSSTAPLPH